MRFTPLTQNTIPDNKCGLSAGEEEITFDLGLN